MKSYRISSKAISDLENIWLYTFNTWSKEQADRYHQLIISEIDFIVTNHELCRKVDHIKKGYQVSQVKSHLILAHKNFYGESILNCKGDLDTTPYMILTLNFFDICAPKVQNTIAYCTAIGFFK
jgi:toxin ParE1/3/4